MFYIGQEFIEFSIFIGLICQLLFEVINLIFITIRIFHFFIGESFGVYHPIFK